MSPSTFWVALFVLDSHSWALRRAAKKDENAGLVDELFLIGAPGPFYSVPDEVECMPGRRIISEWKRGSWQPSTIDAVPSLTSTYGLRHFPMELQMIDLKGMTSNVSKCTASTAKDPRGLPGYPIHYLARYLEALDIMTEREATMTRLANLSYSDDLDEFKREVSPLGLRVAGKAQGSIATWKQVVWLLQNPDTLECVLTFHGTESTEDWMMNFQKKPADFCGMNVQAHTGFIVMLHRLAAISGGFQTEIRPKLGHCSKLTAIGHSLGGAQAELLAACLLSAPGDEDELYSFLSYAKGEPKQLPYL